MDNIRVVIVAWKNEQEKLKSLNLFDGQKLRLKGFENFMLLIEKIIRSGLNLQIRKAVNFHGYLVYVSSSGFGQS